MRRHLHGGFEGRVRLLDDGGQRVAGPGQLGTQAAGLAALAQPAGRTADRAPGAFRGLAVVRPRRGHVPDVGLVAAIATERPAELSGQVLAEAARTRAHQPPLEVTDGVWLPVPLGHLRLLLSSYLEGTSTTGGHRAVRWRGSGRR